MIHDSRHALFIDRTGSRKRRDHSREDLAGDFGFWILDFGLRIRHSSRSTSQRVQSIIVPVFTSETLTQFERPEPATRSPRLPLDLAGPTGHSRLNTEYSILNTQYSILNTQY